MATSAKLQMNNSPKLIPDINLSKIGNIGVNQDSVYTNQVKNYSIDKTFDLSKFNQAYEDVQKRRQTIEAVKEREELASLNKVIYKKRLDQLTIGEMAFNFKDSIFDTLTDLLNFKFNLNNNRLFYLGLLVIISVFIMFMLSPSDCHNGVAREPKYIIY